MSAEAQTARDPISTPEWSLATRLGFRFCFVYFSLFCVTTQVLGGLIPIPNYDFPDAGAFWPTREMVIWTAAHVFHTSQPLVYQGSGSGDKTFDWVLAFCLLVWAAAATAVWSILDRRRKNYVALHKWFRLGMRFALAGQMFGYGMAKAVPLQMPYPSLTRLMLPFGNFSPMSVLWSSIGASPAYEIFAGIAETVGGILLLTPRTSMFGALVCLADMIQVFMLNMTYDVPVKLFSFHLILMTLFLLAPDFTRLAGFFFQNRGVPPSRVPDLFGTRRANHMALGAQIAFGVLLIGANIYGSWISWNIYGGGRPKSALYGIWDVRGFSVDGQPRAPLATDRDRWRRAVFDSPDRMSVQRMDDSIGGYGASINQTGKALTLSKSSDKKWKAGFRFERVGKDRLILDGEMDGHKVQMELKLADRNQFLLVSRGFHWIQEYPFNR